MDKKLDHILAFIEDFKNSYNNNYDRDIFIVLENLQKNINIIVGR